MSDDDTPDNVRQLPRIGSPPPPPVPATPDLNGAAGTGGDDPDRPGLVRISTFDAPRVPLPPSPAPAALHADGLTPPAGPDAGPPHAGALSLAAVLAIALAAFEGLQTWIKESVPLRAEAERHQRELELLAAKAGADARRMGAETDAARARKNQTPSRYDYGHGASGRGPGGSGRGGGGIGGGGGSRRAATGPSGAFGNTSGRGGRPNSPTRLNSPAGSGGGLLGGGGRTGRDGSGGSGSRNRGPGSGWGSGAGGRAGTGGGAGGGSGRGAGPTGSGTAGTGGQGGRRSPRQTLTDWWNGGRNQQKQKSPGQKSPGPQPSAGDTASRIRDAVRKKSGPTFWEQVSSRARDRWKKRSTTDAAGAGGKTAANPANWKPPGDTAGDSTAGERVTLRQAVFVAFRMRWEKRRDDWKTGGGPRRKPPPRTRKPKKPTAKKPTSGNSRRTRTGRKPPPNTPKGEAGSAGGGPFGPRASAFDTGSGPDTAITVEQVDPPGAHAKRWEPDALTTGPRQLPRQSTPALPRAPQRPAGSRPGTTRRKDPFPMPASASSGMPGVVAPVTATVPAAGGLSAQHATELKLDQALVTLTMLTTTGMETHDAAMEVSRQARLLVAALEDMAQDLAGDHNARGPNTMKALAVLMEAVGNLAVQTERMANASMQAAELAEAEEAAMARDHRPLQSAYVDAGVIAPTARIHNEN